MFLSGKSLLEFWGHLQGVFSFFFNSIVASGKILIRKPFLSCDFTCFTDLMDHPSASIITQVSRDEEASAPLRDRGELRESFVSAHVKLLWWMFGARRTLRTQLNCKVQHWMDFIVNSVLKKPHFRSPKHY